MADEIFIGSVSVGVVPDLRGFNTKMRRELLPAATELGKAMGREMTKGLRSEFDLGKVVLAATPKAKVAALVAGQALGKEAIKGFGETFDIGKIIVESTRKAKPIARVEGKALGDIYGRAFRLGLDDALKGVKAKIDVDVNRASLARAVSVIRNAANTGVAAGVNVGIGNGVRNATSGTGSSTLRNEVSKFFGTGIISGLSSLPPQVQIGLAAAAAAAAPFIGQVIGGSIISVLGTGLLAVGVAGAVGLGKQVSSQQVTQDQQKLDAANKRVEAAQQRLNDLQGKGGTSAGSLASARARLASAQDNLNRVEGSGTTTVLGLQAARLRVTAAEENLNKLRGGGKATASQLLGAEAALESARAAQGAAQKKRQDDARNALTKGQESVRESFRNLQQQFTQSLSKIGQSFIPVMNGIATIASDTLSQLTPVFSDAVKKLAGPFLLVVGTFLKSLTSPQFISSIQAVADAFAGILTAFAPDIPGIVQSFADAIERIAHAISANPKAFADFLNFVFQVGIFFTNLVAWLTYAAAWIEDNWNIIGWFILPFINIIKYFPQIRHGIAEQWNLLWQDTVVRAISAHRHLQKLISDWLHNIAHWFDLARHWVATLWDQMWQDTIGRAIRAQRHLQQLISGWLHNMAHWFDIARHDVASAWNTMWDNTVGRAVHGWQTMYRNVWVPVRNFFTTTLPGWFNTAVTKVGQFWDNLKAKVRIPVAWVVNNVLNGLIGAFDWITSHVGLGNPIPKIKGWASGGRITQGTGPTSDNVLALVSRNETIVSAAHSQLPFMQTAFSLAGVPGYARGGKVGQHPPSAQNQVIPGAGSRFGPIPGVDGVTADLARSANKFLDVGKMAAAFATGNRKAFENAFSHLLGMRAPGAGGGILAGILAQIPRLIAKGLVDWIMGRADTASGSGSDIANYAMRFLNKIPYVWGGTSVPGGADCSGFVQAVYEHFKIHAPRTSEAQGAWVKRGPPVSGGLAFYHSPPGGPDPGHVAIVRDAKTVISQGGGMGPDIRPIRYLPLLWTGTPPGGFGAAGSGGPGVQRWRGLVQRALRMENLPASYTGLVLFQMQTESGGDARSINLSDINAQLGTPSKGLMQIIDPTFRAWHWPGTSNNIFDPLANIAAALNYAQHGKGFGRGRGQIGSGHGYARGTDGAAAGWGLVGEQGPEFVHFHGGEIVLPHGVIPGYASGTVDLVRAQIQRDRVQLQVLQNGLRHAGTALARAHYLAEIKIEQARIKILEEKLTNLLRIHSKAINKLAATHIAAFQSAGSTVAANYAKVTIATTAASFAAYQRLFLKDLRLYFSPSVANARSNLIISQNKQMLSLQAQIKALDARIANANQVQKDVLTSIRRTTGLTTIGLQGTGAVQSRNLLASLRSQTGIVRTFGASIRDLARAGASSAVLQSVALMDPTSGTTYAKSMTRALKRLHAIKAPQSIINQLVAVGPEAANAYVDAINAAGPSVRKQIFAAAQQLDAAQLAVSRGATGVISGGAYNTGANFVAGLQAQEKHLNDIFKKLGRTLAQEAIKWFNVPANRRPHGFQHGGWIEEPISGWGLWSGSPYTFAENGRREYVLSADDIRRGGDGSFQGNAYHAHFDGLTGAAIESHVRTAFSAMALTSGALNRQGRRS